jgi:branched-chain amino acid transport system substrate-binding protein
MSLQSFLSRISRRVAVGKGAPLAASVGKCPRSKQWTVLLRDINGLSRAALKPLQGGTPDFGADTGINGMTSTRVLHQAGGALALSLFSLVGCNAIVGLDKIKISDEPTAGAGTGSGGRPTVDGGAGGKAGSTASESGSGATPEAQGGEGGEGGEGKPPGDCTTNQECTDRFSEEAAGEAGAAGAEVVAAACVKTPLPHCVKLLSEDCDSITGDYKNDQAILVGSLFSTKGTTAPTNLPRQQSAALGIEQINMAGGIPNGGTGRPLVMISCDESTDLIRAATHLVSDLHVPAIVGPNTSQHTLDVSTKVTVPGGTVVMSPTGVASSIASLIDDDLTWLMVPSDVQRAPLMIDQIGELETQLKAERAKQYVDLGVVFRNDALGIGTRTALNDLTINGKPLTNAINLNNHVQFDPYNGTDVEAVVAKYLTFLPDIIVLAGTAEAITVMVRLEKDWPAAQARPYYVLIDSTKVPELLAQVTNNEDLRLRVRGTGITSGPPGNDTPDKTFQAFVSDYNVRYGSPPLPSGVGPAHDAAYAIGLALAATRDQPVSGASVAHGLRRLAGGATKLTATALNVRPAFQKLVAGEKISVVGTFGMLDWDANGAVQGGTLEIWCISPPAPPTAAMPQPQATYNGSGLTFDIKTQTRYGTYTQCTTP